jgi:hypothetical protein
MSPVQEDDNSDSGEQQALGSSWLPLRMIFAKARRDLDLQEMRGGTVQQRTHGDACPA